MQIHVILKCKIVKLQELHVQPIICFAYHFSTLLTIQRGTEVTSWSMDMKKHSGFDKSLHQ